MTYRERREARAERRREWAAKRQAHGQARLDTADRMADAIPFGQPILVGHHSERRDRNYRDRITSNMRAGIADVRMADHHERAADTIEAQLAVSIYDDDPDAMERLAARIAECEAERARIVAYNRTCRAKKPDPTLLDDTQRADLLNLARIGFARTDGSFPNYATSNLSGRITRDRQRLARLEANKEQSE